MHVLVRYYAGDPEVGGLVIAETTVQGPSEAEQSLTFDRSFNSFPSGLITLCGVVDPDDQIEECNDGNNTDVGDTSVNSTHPNK